MRTLDRVGNVFVLGGNANTMAFVDSLRPERNIINVRLVPLAFTPLGTVVGDTWQNVGVASAGLLEWIDQTFPSDDEHAFVTPARDVELLARTQWHADPPERLEAQSVLNVEDLPEDVAHALAQPPDSIVQCAACRRLCIRDHFTWNERQLCAWDYHSTVFGKRGPWHEGTYEERHFETLPAPAYVAAPLLEEAGVEVVAAIAGTSDRDARDAINLLLERDAGRAYLAVRTPDGYTLLRERTA